MNKIIITTLIGTAIAMTACSDDNSVFNEPTPIRSYKADAEVLAQFVEVDSRTGLFSINPNKKVMVTDYVVNHSGEQLMEVSSINRSRFEREMEQVNSLIEAYQSVDNVSVVYSTYDSCSVKNNDGGTMCLSKLPLENKEGRAFARLSIAGEDITQSGFYSDGNKRFTLRATVTSTFYVTQVAFRASDNSDKGTILIVGLGMNPLQYCYSMALPEASGEYLNIQGKSLIGNGTVNIGISE